MSSTCRSSICMGKKVRKVASGTRLQSTYHMTISSKNDTIYRPSSLSSSGLPCPSPRFLQNVLFQPVTRKYPLWIQRLPELNPISQPGIHLTELFFRSGRKVLSPMRLPAHLLHEVFKGLVISFPLWWIPQEGSIQRSIQVECGARLTGLVKPWHFGLDGGVGNADFDRGVDVDSPRGKGDARALLVPGEPGL